MDRFLMQYALKLNKASRRRKWWHNIVKTLAIIVVFCTTYALILPAITMEMDVICGNEAHEHKASCYVTRKLYDLQCDLEAEDSVLIRHKHQQECYARDGTLRCTLGEGPKHVHDKSCYAAKATDANAVDRKKPTCLYASMLYHVHGKKCLTEVGEEKILVCKKPIHIHEDSCYLAPESECPKYLCSSGEHVHTEECYNDEKELTCTIPEHIHDVSCLPPGTDLNGSIGNALKGTASNAVKPPAAMLPTAPVPTGGSLEYSGKDYTVVVTYEAEAMIPADAELAVREIEPDTDEYDQYYSQSIGALTEKTAGKKTKNSKNKSKQTAINEQKVGENIVFARFFDITFMVGDEEIEPEAPVEVQIIYDEAIETPVENEGLAVHFAGDGIEVLDTDTHGNHEEEVDRFTFVQNSFSVTGTFVMRTVTVDPLKNGQYMAVTIPFSEMDSSGNTTYVIYTEYDGKYYALVSNYNQKNGYLKEVQMDKNGNIRWEEYSANMFWKVSRNGNSGSSYYVQNEGCSRYLHAFDNSKNGVSDYGTTTQGQNASTLNPSNSGFKALGNRYYTGIVENAGTLEFSRVSDSNNALVFYLARYETSHIWLDGKLGGMMSFNGSDNTHYTIAPENPIFTLPETWKSPTQYDFVLNGWYDINSGEHYEPGEKVVITENTVFYADWIAATYAIGQNNQDIVRTLDTSEFVTIDVFDYNVLFNTLSATHTGTVSSSSHSETWSESDDGWHFLFNDWDGGGTITRANNMGRNNSTYDRVVDNIITDETIELIDLLFDQDVDVIGKHYVGTGNYLFQYMEDPADEYYGYYYYDSDRNAASYYYNEDDPSASRFYVYDYLERTSDAGTGSGADFMPLNSPYANNGNNQVTVDENGMYVYGSRGESGNSTSNFHTGLKTNIHFYLPNDVGYEDAYGNPGNLDTNGKEMVFHFAGDDDVWVFVDGELVLDLGGIHGVESGSINFSTGEVIVEDFQDNGDKVTYINAVRDSDGALTSGIGEGGHNLTIYYLERGSSQSNCKMYFNLAPRYGLELKKQDYHSRDKLEGVEFKVYSDCTNCAEGICQIGADNNCVLDFCNCTRVVGVTDMCVLDEAGNCITDDCQCKSFIGVNNPVVPAKLWNTHEEAKADHYDEHTTNRFTIHDGELELFGMVAGKTYYIVESVPAEGYPKTDDLIRVTLNDHGTDISELTVLSGWDGKRTQGYEIVEHKLNDATRVVSLLLTNQRIISDSEVTQHVRVEKEWILQEENPAEIPDSITVHLTKNEEPYGHSAELNSGNGWTYTWTGLPADGSRYDVIEDQVPGFTIIPPISTFALTEPERTYEVNWLNVAALEDGVSYLIKIGNGYLAQENGSLSVVSVGENGEGKLDPPPAAIWEVTANNEGFTLTNGENSLTLADTNKGIKFAAAREGNQILYYDGTGLFAMRDGSRYYLGAVSGGTANAATAVSAAGLVKQEWIAMDVQTVRLLNYQLNQDEMTYLEVEKVWAETTEAVWEKEVTIRLLANGEDTGMRLVLNNAVDWKGRFEGLPIDVQYSVVEEPVPKYSIHYSDIEVMPGKNYYTLEAAGTLNGDKTYCFVSGNTALAMNKSGNSYSVTGTTINLSAPSENQLWILVGNKLKNIGTGRYLVLTSSSSGWWGQTSYNLSSTDNANNASNISFSNKKLGISSGNTTRYITLSGSSVSVAQNSNSGTSFTVYQCNLNSTPDGYKVIVTNTYGAHELPKTGGMGVNYHTYGGILLLAIAALMYKRKYDIFHRKGDS